MATLYELSGEARHLYALLRDEIIDEETFNDTLESIGAEDKVESYCRVIKQMEADIETEIDAHIAVYEKEISRLKEEKAWKQNNINELKDRLLLFIDACGGTIRRGSTFAAYPRETTSTEILDENIIPKKYKKVKYVLDRTAINDALKSGLKVKGARIKTTRKVIIK